jgi:hypothetical protein
MIKRRSHGLPVCNSTLSWPNAASKILSCLSAEELANSPARLSYIGWRDVRF